MNSLRAYYFFVFGMYAVIVPHYQLFLAALGYSPREVGLLIGFFEILGVAGPIIFGRIADRTGRFRELKIASTIGGGIVLSILLGTWSLPVAVCISGLAGFLLKTSVPLTDAVAGIVLKDPREQYGRVRVFGSVGFAVTAVAVPLLSLLDASSPTSMVIAFLVAIAIFATVVLVVPVPRAAPLGTPAGPNGIRRNPDSEASGTEKEEGSTTAETTGSDVGIPSSFWWVVAAIGVGNVAFGAYNSFFSLYLRTVIGIDSVTLFWAIGAVSEIPIIFFSGRLIRRFGTGTLLVLAGTSMSVRMILYAIRPSIPLIVLVQLMHALSFGLMLSAGIAHVNRVTPVARRGTATTVFNAIGIGFAIFVGATLGGFIVEVVGFAAMFAIIAVFPAISALLFWLLRRRDPHLRPDGPMGA